LRDLCAEADWLVYDAAQTTAEYEALPHWGHSTPQQAAEMALDCGAQQLVLFHHAPKRNDEQVEAMLARVQNDYPDLQITAAAGGHYLMEAE
jgi:ribonuclease BN (tRNA processing enzyme)